MTEVWVLATLWLGLAIIAGLLASWFRVSTALSEIAVGMIAQLVVGAAIGSSVLGADESWVKFLSGIGAIVLTFLAGAELDPVVFKLKWREAAAIGLASFFLPFFGCAAAAHYLLGWDPMASWLAGVAMSTTSVAVVYAVMIEFGFNTTDYGKTVLAACFITDLGTVGARAADVLRQFLIEAVVLCLLGGAFGILVGRGGSFLVHSLLKWPIEPSMPAVVLAVTVSAGVGLIFGYYPAWKASRLDPIEALRYE